MQTSPQDPLQNAHVSHWLPVVYRINSLNWLHSLSVKNRVLLDRVVWSASKTIASTLPTVDELYKTYMMKKTRAILKDTSHPLHEFYSVAQSGCRYISERTRTIRYRNTFPPTSVRLLNAKSGRGKLSGRMGGYNGAHYFPTTLHCHCHY